MHRITGYAQLKHCLLSDASTQKYHHAVVHFHRSLLAFLRLPVGNCIRVVGSDHVKCSFPFPSVQEPAYIVRLEELTICIVVMPERRILRSPDVLASLMQDVEFPSPLCLKITLRLASARIV